MRVYHQPIAFTSGVSTPVQVDIFELVAAAEKPVMILGWEFGQTSEVGDAQEEQLELVLKRMLTITSGSGGTATVSGNPADHNDPAKAYTFENGNTTKATASTTQELRRFVWNVRMPHLWVPVPEERISVAGATHGLVLELVQTPVDAITKVSGGITIAEFL